MTTILSVKVPVPLPRYVLRNVKEIAEDRKTWRAWRKWVPSRTSCETRTSLVKRHQGQDECDNGNGECALQRADAGVRHCAQDRANIRTPQFLWWPSGRVR